MFTTRSSRLFDNDDDEKAADRLTMSALVSTNSSCHERRLYNGNGMILNHMTYKYLLNSRNVSTLKQVSKYIGIVYSECVCMYGKY